ncbi:MAG: primosomal protein N' [Gammaproteobacteria bacterium]
MSQSTPGAILKVAVPSPLYTALDYLPPESTSDLQPGMRVQVPLKGKNKVGILLSVTQQSSIPHSKLRPAIAVLDSTPLVPTMILQLLQWASDYYHHPIGEVMQACLPGLLRRGRETKNAVFSNPATGAITYAPALELNPAQQLAVEAIGNANSFNTFLLDGVTGSGKTEVYLQAIARVLAAQRQALILVPEIGLTPQMLARFQQRFTVPIAVLHSKLADRERFETWLAAKAGQIPIVIGTRSAVFTPLPKLGLIILDEEHDVSFKQQSGFRYSARDLAIMRGHMENIPVLLGSATPSLESLQNTLQGRYQRLSLPSRAGTAALPRFSVVDIRQQPLDEGLSAPLLDAIKQHTQQGSQVLLFLNRRGYAPTLLCHHCGWHADCERCDARLTLHQKPRQLFCHHCGKGAAVPSHCSKCQSSSLLALGLGTERIELALERHFPDITRMRIDSDTTRRKGSLQEMLDSIHEGQSQILIGTQMLTKGHHFPNVTLVGIVHADQSLFSADFRALERLGQLITQVAGRAGRAAKAGEVMLQTHHPDHPLLQQLLREGYQPFSQTLLGERQAAQLPPFAYLTIISAEALQQQEPLQFLQVVAEIARANAGTEVQVLGPIPALMERRAGHYRAQLLLRSNLRRSLQDVLKQLINRISTLETARKVRWSIDVDPQEMF